MRAVKDLDPWAGLSPVNGISMKRLSAAFWDGMVKTTRAYAFIHQAMIVSSLLWRTALSSGEMYSCIPWCWTGQKKDLVLILWQPTNPTVLLHCNEVIVMKFWWRKLPCWTNRGSHCIPTSCKSKDDLQFPWEEVGQNSRNSTNQMAPQLSWGDSYCVTTLPQSGNQVIWVIVPKPEIQPWGWRPHAVCCKCRPVCNG